MFLQNCQELGRQLISGYKLSMDFYTRTMTVQHIIDIHFRHFRVSIDMVSNGAS